MSGGRGCRGSVGRFPSDGGDIGANYEVGEYLVRKRPQFRTKEADLSTFSLVFLKKVKLFAEMG